MADSTIQRLTRVFKLLSDPMRIKILMALAQNEEMHVTALCQMLKQSQPAVSHHLTLMRMTGLVAYRREGKHNFYYLESGQLRELLELIFPDGGNGHRQIRFDNFALSYSREK